MITSTIQSHCCKHPSYIFKMCFQNSTDTRPLARTPNMAFVSAGCELFCNGGGGGLYHSALKVVKLVQLKTSLDLWALMVLIVLKGISCLKSVLFSICFVNALCARSSLHVISKKKSHLNDFPLPMTSPRPLISQPLPLLDTLL